MFPRPRHHTQKMWANQRGNEIRILAGTLVRLLDEKFQNDRRGAQARAFLGKPHETWRPNFFGKPRCEWSWQGCPTNTRPRNPRPRVQPRRGPPVAAMKVPPGSTMANGKRGSLMGAIPEALCGEAPQGQSMIRGETLEVVSVEAPKGQPAIHRRHPRQAR